MVNESDVEDAGRRERRSPPPLRLLGGGGGRDSDEEGIGESDEAHQGLASHGSNDGMETGHKSRSKSRATARRGARSGAGGRDGKKEQRKGEEVSGEKSTPHRSQSLGGSARIVVVDDDPGSPALNWRAEALRRVGLDDGGNSSSQSEAPTERMETSPAHSPVGTKRVRETGKEVGVGEPGGSRDSPPVEGIKRRRDGSEERRGRSAKTPENKEKLTREKIAERKMEVERRRAEETVEFLIDPARTAKTKRALSAERNALRKMSDLREVPTASLTQIGIDAVETIKKIAATSANLTGPYVGALWRIAEDLTAMNMVLTRRAQEAKDEDGARRASELEELRILISTLRTNEALLQGQVRKLREEVERGEKERTAPPQRETDDPPGKGGGRKSGPPIVLHSSSSEEDEWEEGRDLSPTSREVGRRARREVRRDLAEGTMPPAMRPSILGRSQVLGAGGVPPACAEVQPPHDGTDSLPPPPPPVGGAGVLSGGWGMEEVVQAVVRTLVASGLVPTPGPTKATRGPVPGGSRREEEGGRKAPLHPPPPPAVRETAAVEGQGGKKRRKKKKKKGRKRNAGTEVPAPDTAPSKGGAPQPAGPAAVGGPGQATWAEVTRRGGKRATGAATRGGQTPLPISAPQPAKGKGGKGGATLPRGPRGAAVTITCPEGRYAEVLTEARGAIKLQELGISGIRARRAVTGAMVLEIPGQEGAGKAEALRKRMADLFAGRGEIRVSRPVRRSEVRFRDMDDSATAEDVVSAVAETGGCTREEVLVGPIKKGPNGLNTVWVRCPLVAARKVVAGGRLTIGWTAARVEALTVRPLQCFKCWREGHVRAQCPSEVDRSGMCYRCGFTGHKAGQCTEPARCPVCRDANLPSEHRLGGKACKGVKAGAKRKMPPRQETGKEKGVGTPGGTTEAPPQEVGEVTPPQGEEGREEES